MILAHRNFIVALEAQSKLWNVRASSSGRGFYLYPGSPTPKHLTGANRRYIQSLHLSPEPLGQQGSVSAHRSRRPPGRINLFHKGLHYLWAIAHDPAKLADNWLTIDPACDEPGRSDVPKATKPYVSRQCF